MAKKKRTTTDAVEILHHRYIKGSKKRLESIEREREKLTIAEQIYQLRTKAGLTQKQLADMIGTTQSVISRLGDDTFVYLVGLSTQHGIRIISIQRTYSKAFSILRKQEGGGLITKMKVGEMHLEGIGECKHWHICGKYMTE